ncbi:MAG: hypothetical protein FH749_13400 [Firmicutes bacterium]|nr:hypothetical protein [Bacillota bacterium]
MEIPAFMLKKLYKKGSLTNTDGGVSFIVKNSISPATIIGLDQLLIDGEEVEIAKVKLITSKSEVNAAEITEEQSLHVNWNDAITLVVDGLTLASGSHKLALTINTRDVGPLTLEVSDTLAG